MNKKTTIYIGVGIILAVIIGGIFIWSTKRQNQIRALTQSQIAEQSAGKTNNFQNSQLIEIAKQYVLNKPRLYWNRVKFIDWNNYNELGSDFSKATPEWIISQKVFVSYNEPNKNKPPYDDLNDKYIVSWFFIPGCEENPTENIAKPNWFDKLGRQCMGGYSLGIIINPDGTMNHAELNALW